MKSTKTATLPDIRPLLPRHATELMKLRHAAIRQSPEAFGTSPEVELCKTIGDYRKQLLKIATRRGECLLGLWEDEKLIGMTGLGRRGKYPEEYALIYSMYLYPEYRRLGFARHLLEHCARFSREKWHLTQCRLCVEIHNAAALNLYQCAGYEIISREPRAFRLRGATYDVYHLRRDLTARPPLESTP
ncbi:MAG: GNAT family N-acetyltransferase [Verrucomicrobia bacterium]|nr:GNAT family N-acetyltransferase [Verrucomicrobiota bacterium]MCH8513840.1 GNAT family N-acetyltransferase [Kiritimatiellia bacterium]